MKMDSNFGWTPFFREWKWSYPLPLFFSLFFSTDTYMTDRKTEEKDTKKVQIWCVCSGVIVKNV